MTAIFSRTVTPRSGHLEQNTKFSKKRIAAIKEHLGVDVEVYVRLGGPAGQILMFSKHDSVADIEEMRRKVMEGVAAGIIPQPDDDMASSVDDGVWLSV